MNRQQWFIVAFISTIHLLAFSHRMEVVPFLVDLKAVYHVGFAEAGGLVSSFLLGYAIFQIPAGTMADRYSPRRLMMIGIMSMMVSAILFALIHTFFLALVLRFIMGASAAMIFSPAIKLISVFTPKEKRGISIGILEGAAGMGMLLSLTVFPILSAFVEWQVLFLFLSILLLPVLLMFPKVPKEEIAQNGKEVKESQPGGIMSLLKNKKILRLLAIAFFGLFGLYGFLAWTPTYMESELGYTKQETGLIMAVIMAAQIVAAPISGKLSDFLGQRKLMIIIGSLIMAVSALWLLLLGNAWIYFVAILIGTGLSWSIAPMLALATEIVNVNIAGSVISIMNTVGQVASALSGYVYGLLFDTFGNFQMIWLVCFIAFLIRTLCCFGELENHHSSKTANKITI
ncbi:MFS transporter [Peribacillus glennii]|uniref:MFS transporter n=1 Tax=Peribacillus glennii TaxID=2303991 RepID=A0A372LFI6_9BACI|nr:MFS transporter [Peribacillus glennii]RFU65050.1 MFS transporter [Peribacillus glennii]